MADAFTVYVVDDDPGVRAALRDLLESVGYVVFTFSGTNEFLEADLVDQPSCLVLDVRMPGMGGLELQEQLVAEGSQLPIIFMTGHGDIRMSVRGMKAGATDFLEKPVREQDLLDALASAFKASQQTLATYSAAQSLQERYETLSPRERQVLGLVSIGLMNKQVAGELGISEVTVKVHRAAAMRKMQAKTFAELARMAQVLGIADPRTGRP